jgi:hypothetical protein
MSLSTTAQVLAHHSYAMFDRSKEVVIEGTVRELQWTNPHSWLVVDVKDTIGSGSTAWQIELGPPGTLARAGWSRTLFHPGDKVKVKMHPLRDGRAGGGVMLVVGPDGREYSDIVGPTPGRPHAKVD